MPASKNPDRPLILLGHSLGGILIKQVSSGFGALRLRSAANIAPRLLSMLSTIPNIGISKKPHKYLNTLVGIIDADKKSYSLVFFNTPHNRPGDDWKIVFRKTSIQIAQSLPSVQSNNIIEKLKHGSLFSDALQSQ